MDEYYLLNGKKIKISNLQGGIWMKITLLYVLTTVFFLLALSMDSILGMVFYLIISGGMFYWAKLEKASMATIRGLTFLMVAVYKVLRKGITMGL